MKIECERQKEETEKNGNKSSKQDKSRKEE